MGKSIYVFFFGSFDLLCVNLETKVSSQLSSNCNIWWHGEAEGGAGWDSNCRLSVFVFQS